jgi:type IV pilus assembly protein PilE
MNQISRGFHLVEMLSTLAIMSILVALCLPLYSNYLMQGRRLEAATSLSTLAIAMEKFHIEHHTYADATLAALHIPETLSGNHYRLMIQTASNHDYTLLAEPIGKQAKDDNCKGLLLYADGRKAVTGTARMEECWSSNHS